MTEDTRTARCLDGQPPRDPDAKLAHARLDTFFAPLKGGFGDLHADRVDIVRMGADACGHGPDARLVVSSDTI